MSNTTWGNAVGHALTIVRGYTGIAFQEGPVLNIGGPAGSDDLIMARWISTDVPVLSGTMKFVADKVRIELSGVVSELENDPDEPYDSKYYFDGQSIMASPQFQIQCTMVHSRVNSNTFNATRIMSFVGGHFFRFED